MEINVRTKKIGMRMLHVSQCTFLHFSEHMQGLQHGQDNSWGGGPYHSPVQFTPCRLHNRCVTSKRYEIKTTISKTFMFATLL